MGVQIGFVGTRFAGTDGVSLESAKWAQVLWDHRHVSHWYSGLSDRDPSVSMVVPHAYFNHPDIQWINRRAFGTRTRTPDVTQRIYTLADYLKGTLYEFTRRYHLDLLIVQNALCIPMNIPLGVALTNFIAETGFPTIAHHHDFYWERDRFSVSAVTDMLWMAFPPALPQIQNVTINSFAQEDLSHRRGVSSVLVPNVLDFENPPPEADEYSRCFRKDIGLAEDDILFLQPTRVVPRKGIEHAISLVAALKDDRCKLVISHASGDEGNEYLQVLKDLAEQSGVDLRLVDEQVGDKRGKNADGNRIYTLADAYSQADFITYPSIYEGFGNALLEAFYYRKPLLVNRYSIYVADIEPKGAKVISMDGYLTKDVVAKVKRIISDQAYRDEMVDFNYEIGRAFFSYGVLRRKLRALVTNFTGQDNL
ncbi:MULTISPECIES: glycosyltransferase family 4 protein [Pirellulaceae]|uniref:Glycosyltransferase involved in cell wall biosynthesis n=1 Tax=Aporhodopirellula rubra TaxID=980271 RepID=A0A7W5DZ82_9BACT|nr:MULTISPECIES: glycosyltransferase family 4 protein [Pirellulaceae]EMI42816.1 glycosyl transferase group 1 [Rhodopirellula sp. SWK7]MBB3206892.1 glycosyltransferase involved in cell wall biosynthesis [Aporhodopirellula rubra]